MNFYTQQKLIELERERLDKITHVSLPAPRPRKTLFGPVAAGAGRTLRRLGEGLEHWGSPAPSEHEHTHAHSHIPHI